MEISCHDYAGQNICNSKYCNKLYLYSFSSILQSALKENEYTADKQTTKGL